MKITVLTGAGISAESGLSTFRDSNGLWEDYDVMEVASISGYQKNPDLVNKFYNERRQQLSYVFPNDAHYSLTELQKYHDVTIVTQNVDDLHERACNTNIIHLHGELLKSRDIVTNKVYIQKDDITSETLSIDGNILRPHIVWFGETVDELQSAIDAISQSDMVIVIGTSLNVYPAAGLIDILDQNTRLVVIDPNPPAISRPVEYLRGTAAEMLPIFVVSLLQNGY